MSEPATDNGRPLPDVPQAIAAAPGPTDHPTGRSDLAAAAAAHWRALAPLLAGRPRVRISRDGGRNYHLRWERALTDQVPHQPAAVPLYTASGECRVLVIDLDTSKGGPAAVQRDADSIRTLVHRCGGKVISDHSPNGGIHLYLPLTEPVPFHTARDLAVALAGRTPTMDPSPNHNLTAGLIRPPGSRHRTGGFQVLDGSLSAAHHLATTGNPPTVWHALRQALGAELAALHTEPAPPAAAGMDAQPGHHRELTPRYAQIARTGLYDATRYRSPSEARQAVITSAVAAGMTLPQVITRLETGTWPGLASLYARYRPGTRHGAITRDYHSAVAYLTRTPRPAPTTRDDLVSKSHTSGHPSHGGGPPGADLAVRGSPTEYQWLRQWDNAVCSAELARYGGRVGYGIRFVLRSLGEAARKTGSRYVEFGVRSLAIATGLDHGTVAGHLRTLREEAEPFLHLIREHHGLDGDLYELVIPAAEQQRANRAHWRPGQVNALRPVFRELGHVAALVYEALERSPSPMSTTELIDTTQISRAGVHRALETLGAFHLATCSGGKWTRVAATSLALLAEQFGCLDAVGRQKTKYAEQRVRWRALVTSRRYLTGEIIIDDFAWLPWPEPPPEDPGHTLFDLIDTHARSA